VLGDLTGQGDCTTPQAIAATESYSCSYSAQFLGLDGDVLKRQFSAVLEDESLTPIPLVAEITVKVILADGIFVDGFEDE
jgi:hypothetical protein